MRFVVSPFTQGRHWNNPSVSTSSIHLPLHKGGFGGARRRLSLYPWEALEQSLRLDFVDPPPFTQGRLWRCASPSFPLLMGGIGGLEASLCKGGCQRQLTGGLSLLRKRFSAGMLRRIR